MKQGQLKADDEIIEMVVAGGEGFYKQITYDMTKLTATPLH